MSTIEAELWNIFTHYSLHGSPRDPSRLLGLQFLKLCKDAKVMEPTMTDTPMTQADLHLIVTSVLKNRGHQAADHRLDYEEFLSCLTRVAQRCYSRASPDDAMQLLLMDNILPLAARRHPIALTSILTQPAVEALFDYYQEALHDIFRYYASNSDHLSRNMIRATSTTCKSFDETRNQLREEKEHAAPPGTKSISSQRLGYFEYLKFATDFGLASSMALTTLDLGDIYLSVISLHNFETSLRSITFKEFWEVMVRCALVAFRKHTKITTENKLKGMFLYIWRHMQHSISENIVGNNAEEGGSFLAFRGALLRGSKILNEKFILSWNKDGFRDYLEENIPIDPSQVAFAASLTQLLSSASISADTPTAPVATTNKRTPNVVINIDESDEFGDDRIKPAMLRKLLIAKPELALLLYNCVKEEGIASYEESS